MTVNVELECSGHGRYRFRLTLPTGEREFIGGDTWTRKSASAALDLLERLYHINRRSIRFEVR